jgi:hypothetical protein
MQEGALKLVGVEMKSMTQGDGRCNLYMMPQILQAIYINNTVPLKQSNGFGPMSRNHTIPKIGPMMFLTFT